MKRLVLSICLLFGLGLFSYAQNTSDFEIQGNDDGTMTILNYKGLAKEIVIPEKIFNMPVTRLREGAFSEKGLTKVTIPNTVTFIGDNTFSENQLTSITIPDAVEYIGNSAFRRNRLTSVSIPDSATFIGNSAFAGNYITGVTIGNGVVFIGSEAFSGTEYSGNNQITSITLGTGIKYIGSSAFQYHRASSIIIPNNVVYIGSLAFTPNSRNSLTTITIGKYVMFATGNSVYGAFYNNGNFDAIYQNNDKRAGKYTYANSNWTYAP